MSRYRGPNCRLCRRENIKLFLKGDRCSTDKCSFDRRGYAPGQHGQRRSKHSDYGVQLREKQKAKRLYGILEKQFRTYFYKAERAKGVTGENLLLFLEKRLDNMVYRAGFSASRKSARQVVKHGHFLVNNKRVNIPSFQVKVGDLITIKEKSRTSKLIIETIKSMEKKTIPNWLETKPEEFSFNVVSLPKREEIPEQIEEHLIVELYSK